MENRSAQPCSKRRALLSALAILAGGGLVALFFFCVSVLPVARGYTARAFFDNEYQNTTPPLSTETQVEQWISINTGDALYGVEFAANTYAQVVQGAELAGYLEPQDGGEAIPFSGSYDEIRNGERFFAPFEEGVTLPGGDYRMVMWLTRADPEHPLSLWLSNNAKMPCFVGGAEMPTALVLGVMGDSWFMVPYYWAIAGTLAVFLAVFWLLVFYWRWKIHHLFLPAALVLGVLYMFVYLPYSFPDSEVHVRKTLYHSDRLLGAEVLDAVYPLVWERRAEDSMEGFTLRKPQRQHYQHVYSHLFQGEQNPGATETDQVDNIGYAAQYAVPALGVTLAKLLGMGQVATIYMGQLFNLLFFAGAMVLILRWAPFKTLFCLVGLTPFVLHISGTYSYDVPINVLCFAYLGLVFSLSYEKERVSLPAKLLLGALVLLIAPQKLLYIPLLLLALLVPLDKWFPGRKRRAPISGAKKWLLLAGVGVCLLAVVALVSWQLISSSINYIGVEYGILNGEKVYTFRLFLTNPLEALRLYAVTLLDTTGEIVTAGGGLLYYPLPVWVMLIVAFLYVASLSPVQGESRLAIPRGHKIWMGTMALGVFFLAATGALTWTFYGSYYMGHGGIQGRYFIPLYPLLPLLAAGLFQRPRNNDRSLVYTMAILNAYAILSIFLQATFN